MLQATPLITMALPFAVVLYQFRVRLAALFVVIRTLGTSYLLAFQYHLVILGVSRQLLAVIIATPAALTLRPGCRPLV